MSLPILRPNSNFMKDEGMTLPNSALAMTLLMTIALFVDVRLAGLLALVYLAMRLGWIDFTFAALTSYVLVGLWARAEDLIHNNTLYLLLIIAGTGALLL